MKNLVGRCNGTSEQSEKKSTNENKSRAILIDSKEQKGKRMRKCEDSQWYKWNFVKWNDICITGDPEGH